MSATPPASPTPSCCAGLRQALLHDWQADFPLHDSPFQALARRLGSSVREVVAHCRALEQEGALAAIRIVWGTALQRMRCRLALRLAEAPGPEWARALAALPGLTEWAWAEAVPQAGDSRADGVAAGAPERFLWFDLAARDSASLQAQRDAFEARHAAAVCMELSSDAGAAARCDCGRGSGPCSDVDLARRCEAPLPLVAHPYRALSKALERSEREVLATLRCWRASGRVQGVGLAPDAGGVESPCRMVAVAAGAEDSALAESLLARPGVAAVQWLPEHAQWPRRLLVIGSGAPQLGAGALQRALAACGLGARDRQHHLVRRVRVRAAPLIFTAPDPEPADRRVP
jgi:DNA-binding Lrp family transcriptional regulator